MVELEQKILRKLYSNVKWLELRTDLKEYSIMDAAYEVLIRSDFNFEDENEREKFLIEFDETTNRNSFLFKKCPQYLEHLVEIIDNFIKMERDERDFI
jgi:hypothetical protein